MTASRHVSVQIDLAQVRRNVEAVRQRVGVSLLAVVKADAYGLGAARVVPIIEDIVDGYCVFSLAEAGELNRSIETHKSCLVLSPDGTDRPQDYIELGARPAVASPRRASLLKSARPVLSVDTGMQRFACPADQVEAALRAGACDEAYTHATSLAQVDRLRELVGGKGLRLHAAGSSLLDEPAARLDAVRPGLALYRDSVTVRTTLVEAQRSAGPVGYTGFRASHHGVILAGYSHGLRKGPCLVNGVRRNVVEVGMQSAFVETGPADRAGDEVVLLGGEVTLDLIADAWRTTPHLVLVLLCGLGQRSYLPA